MRTSQINNPVEILSKNGAVYVALSGDVLTYNSESALKKIVDFIQKGAKQISFMPDGLGNWDSSLILLIYDAVRIADNKGIKADLSKLPTNLQDLVKMAFEVDRKPEHKGTTGGGLLETVGRVTVNLCSVVSSFFNFLGAVTLGIGRFLSFRSIMRGIDFCAALRDCGPKALAIVSLISFLVGLILAFVGAVQLQTFGAQIYVASLVTVGMCRIMGAIMVGIIMAGRTGSSYAATIGTMQVNEELDALQTMGLSQVDFLVMPRLLALVLAMPILTMLADFMGMLGGGFVGVFLMGLPYQEYFRYAINAFTLNNFLVGIFHGFCFGIIIALCGCYSGLTCGRNADSVGVATTRSVVYAVVWMIVITGIITVICQEIGV
jgi:phospholipid/cholesterol/gamma-HCH transport system permease protein